jgi:hypothetical protein
MDDILQAQFERVDLALGTLVDSIAAYNPSPQAAVDLVAADDELSRGLDQRTNHHPLLSKLELNRVVTKHQANHARIQTLRSEAEALEAQLRSSVATLASLRKELFETPATTFPEESRPVPFDELLQYAKNISQWTVPPTFRERLPDALAEPDKDKDRPAGDFNAAATNGFNTPTAAPGLAEPPREATDTQMTEDAPPEITAEEEEWLKKLKDSQIAWYPWPDNDKIRRGNLMKIYDYGERGFDLSTFDIHAHEEAERLKNQDSAAFEQLPVEHPPQEPQLPPQAQAAAPPPAEIQHIPQPERATFDAFDDLDE